MYYEVDEDIIGDVVSIMNSKKGSIIVDSVGEIITDNAVVECDGEVVIRGS